VDGLDETAALTVCCEVPATKVKLQDMSNKNRKIPLAIQKFVEADPIRSVPFMSQSCFHVD